MPPLDFTLLFLPMQASIGAALPPSKRLLRGDHIRPRSQQRQGDGGHRGKVDG